MLEILRTELGSRLSDANRIITDRLCFNDASKLNLHYIRLCQEGEHGNTRAIFCSPSPHAHVFPLT